MQCLQVANSVHRIVFPLYKTELWKDQVRPQVLRLHPFQDANAFCFRSQFSKPLQWAENKTE